ncbi:hypothetical protein ATCC90586_004932 [Pythium insidiosum]|nr:hypothetical protein ATCC90586_004932 [Pythium insidiosum]
MTMATASLSQSLSPTRHRNKSPPSLSPEATVDQKRIVTHRSAGRTSRRAHVVEVLLTDPDRFASYRNYAKNHQTAMATEVVTHNTLVKEELVAWVESQLGCVVPNAESYSKRELLDLVVVAKSVEQLGAKELDRLYSSGAMKDLQNIALKPYALRRNDKQREYREQSKSKRKDEQHVAHYIGVDVIAQLNKELAPSDRIGEEALGKLVNLPQNMRMVLEKTNLGLHKEVDAILLNKDATIADVTAKQAKRMRQIAKVAQSEAMQQAFIDAGAAKLYDKLRETLSKHDKPGRAKIWDKRHDKEPLRAPSIAAERRQSAPPTKADTRDRAHREETQTPKPRPTLYDKLRYYVSKLGPRGGTYYINSKGNRTGVQGHWCCVVPDNGGFMCTFDSVKIENTAATLGYCEINSQCSAITCSADVPLIGYKSFSLAFEPCNGEFLLTVDGVTQVWQLGVVDMGLGISMKATAWKSDSCSGYDVVSLTLDVSLPGSMVSIPVEFPVGATSCKSQKWKMYAIIGGCVAFVLVAAVVAVCIYYHTCHKKNRLKTAVGNAKVISHDAVAIQGLPTASLVTVSQPK